MKTYKILTFVFAFTTLLSSFVAFMNYNDFARVSSYNSEMREEITSLRSDNDKLRGDRRFLNSELKKSKKKVINLNALFD